MYIYWNLTIDFFIQCKHNPTCPVKILTRATFPLYSHHESTEDDGGVIILIIKGRWKGGGVGGVGGGHSPQFF